MVSGETVTPSSSWKAAKGTWPVLKEITDKLTAISTVVAEQNSVFGHHCQMVLLNDSF